MRKEMENKNLKLFVYATVFGWAYYYIYEACEKEEILKNPFWISCLDFLNENGEIEYFVGGILGDKIYVKHQKITYNPCIQIGCEFLKKFGYEFRLDLMKNSCVWEEIKEISDKIGVESISMKGYAGSINRSSRDDERLGGNLIKDFDYEFQIKEIADILDIEIEFGELCYPKRIKELNYKY